MSIKALEWASVSIGVPLLGSVERRSLLRALRKKFYQEKFLRGVQEIRKTAL
jgi:hypothetical protein